MGVKFCVCGKCDLVFTMATKKTFTTTTKATKAIRRVKVTKTTQKTLPDGRVVTETTTEYKEATDDSGFSDLVGSSNFPQISGNSSFGDAVVQSKPAAESSESSSDEEEDEEKFEEEALKAHNDCRAKHGVELLKWEKICFVHGHPMPKPSVLEISQLIVGIPK